LKFSRYIHQIGCIPQKHREGFAWKNVSLRLSVRQGSTAGKTAHPWKTKASADGRSSYPTRPIVDWWGHMGRWGRGPVKVAVGFSQMKVIFSRGAFFFFGRRGEIPT